MLSIFVCPSSSWTAAGCRFAYRSTWPWCAGSSVSRTRWVQADASDPLRKQARVLAGRKATIWTSAARKQKIAKFLVVGLEVYVDCLAGLLSDFEFDRSARLPLSYRGTVDGITDTNVPA